MSGIYSDTFFRSFLCRSFALQPSWLSTETVPTLAHSQVTTTKFVKEYEEKNIPLLIKGASSSWPALGGNGGSSSSGGNDGQGGKAADAKEGGEHKWTPEYLLKTCAANPFRATSGAAPLPATFTFRNYLNYCTSTSTEEAPLYLFDRTFATKVPRLLEDFDGGMKESCPWWSGGNEEAGHDLFGVLGEGRRPDYQWLIVGPKRSGSCFHIDPNCTHAWNAPIIGRKRWIFYPPGVTPPGVYPSPSGDDVCMPISIGEWFLTYWDAHVERRSDPDVSRRPLECTAEPGDVLFVPHGWWHMVLNIGDDDETGTTNVSDGNNSGISVALTRNYVSASNLPDVLRFLDTRVSQISGCRDRAEAVPPEKLGEEFRKGLMSAVAEEEEDEQLITAGGGYRDGEEKKCDDGQESSARRGKWADLLRKAEEQAKKGWGCNAWVDLPSSRRCGDANHNAVEDCNNISKEEKATGGTSILARAKQQQQPQPDMDANGSGSGAIAASTATTGFSFSFL